MAPKDVHMLTPRICEHITFHGMKDVIQLRILKWEILLDYLGVQNVTTGVLHGGGRRVRVKDVTMAEEIGVMTLPEGAHEPRKPWKRPGNGFSLRASRRSKALLTHLGLRTPSSVRE